MASDDERMSVTFPHDEAERILQVAKSMGKSPEEYILWAVRLSFGAAQEMEDTRKAPRSTS